MAQLRHSILECRAAPIPDFTYYILYIHIIYYALHFTFIRGDGTPSEFDTNSTIFT